MLELGAGPVRFAAQGLLRVLELRLEGHHGCLELEIRLVRLLQLLPEFLDFGPRVVRRRCLLLRSPRLTMAARRIIIVVLNYFDVVAALIRLLLTRQHLLLLLLLLLVVVVVVVVICRNMRVLCLP